MNVTPDQIRAARALLRLEQTDLAERAHVSVVTIRRVETLNARERVSAVTFDSIKRALENAGAEFIPDGVRRRGPAQPGPGALFDDLRAISLRSARQLQDHDLLTENDLYDEDGLPA